MSTLVALTIRSWSEESREARLKTLHEDIDRASIDVDSRTVPLAALQQSAYEYAHQATTKIELNSERLISLLVSVATGSAHQTAQAILSRAGEIAIQHRINEQTSVVREALVKAALWESLSKQTGHRSE